MVDGESGLTAGKVLRQLLKTAKAKDDGVLSFQALEKQGNATVKAYGVLAKTLEGEDVARLVKEAATALVEEALVGCT